MGANEHVIDYYNWRSGEHMKSGNWDAALRALYSARWYGAPE